MTVWKIAMLCLLPLMLGRHRARTWAVLFGNALVAMLLPPMSVQAYIVLDAVCGALVMAKPAGCAQRAIGVMFAVMVLFHVGYLISGNPGVSEYYWAFNVAVGWAQWGALLSWGIYDGTGYIVRHLRGRSRLVAGGKVDGWWHRQSGG